MGKVRSRAVNSVTSGMANEVTIQWGDYGPIKNIRANVARFPYLTEGRNSDIDVKAISAR